MNKRELELYIHIPFCARKCAYCDFLSFAAPERVYRDYMDKLMEEICGQGPNFQEYRVSTIFVGGGTPSLLPADLIMELTDKIVREKHLTTIMVTHNLRYAVEYGNRLLMMHQGGIVMDLKGEEKAHLEVEQILDKFNEISIECGN